MDPQSSLRVGLVGFGVAGAAFHAPIISATPGLQLTAVVATSPVAKEKLGERYPETQILASVDDLVSLAPDIAVVATPNETHFAIAQQLLEAGIATVVDKPLATSVTQARSLIETATRCGTLLTCYQNRRWDGDFRTVRELIDSETLGDVFRFESRFERWRPNIKPGWKERPTAGSGVLFDLGPHLIDQAIQLFGTPTKVYSEIRTIRQDAEVDDSAYLALTHKNGVTSHLSMSAIAAVPGPRFRVLGTDAGYLKYGFDPQEADLRAGGRPDGIGTWGEEPKSHWGELCQGEERSPVATLLGCYPTFYAELAKAVRSGGKPPVDPQDCVVALEVIEQALGDAQYRFPTL
ncbi:Gfo/Idh/MocA family oxidoreductase [Candidatus Nanopelagicales bacterium]|nr:Gfo/Idh/MocA family oxidoreductase [Candidatus Nanopelagicales bacterium]